MEEISYVNPVKWLLEWPMRVPLLVIAAAVLLAAAAVVGSSIVMREVNCSRDEMARLRTTNERARGKAAAADTFAPKPRKGQGMSEETGELLPQLYSRS